MKRILGIMVMVAGAAQVASAQEAGDYNGDGYVDPGTDDGAYNDDNAPPPPEATDGEPDDSYDDLSDDQPGTTIQVPPEAQANVDMRTFEQTLAPAGDWVQTPSYGRVWRPNPVVVGADFRPYATGGHWVYASYGWTWVSDYNWGWAPFHYGRWYVDASYGWVWVPGTQWGPAWVDWRHGSGYVGWAPLGPRGYRAAADWCFVPQTRFRSRYVYRHFVPSRSVYSYTRPYSRNFGWRGRSWNAGPSVASFRSWRRPAYRQPVYQRPVYHQRYQNYQRPAYRQPVYQRPAYQQRHQNYQRPSYRQPTTYQRPNNPQPYRQPSYQRPSYQQRVSYHERPSYQQPRNDSYRQPANNGGGRGGWNRGGEGRGNGGGWGHGRRGR